MQNLKWIVTSRMTPLEFTCNNFNHFSCIPTFKNEVTSIFHLYNHMVWENE